MKEITPIADAQEHRARNLALFLAANALFGAGLFAHAFLYNFYLDALGLGEGVMGVAAAALTAGGITALVPAGALVDRMGVRPAYLMAAALGFAGLTAGAFMTEPWTIYGAAFVAGAGASTWRVVSGPALMRLATGALRARAFSWNVALLVGSGALWIAVSGALPRWLERLFGMTTLGGLRGALVVGAAGTLAAAFVFLATRIADGSRQDAALPEGGQAGAGPPASGVAPKGAFARRPLAGVRIPGRLVFLVCLVFVWMTGSALVLPFFNIFFQREHGMSIDRIGLAFGAAQALTALVIAASGELAARFGTARALTVWMLLFAPALWALSMVETLGLAIGLFLFQGLVPPATNPLIDQVLLEGAPERQQGAVSGWRNGATELSGLVGAAVGGRLLEASSFATLFGTAATVALVGALGWITGLRRVRGSAPSAE